MKSADNGIVRQSGTAADETGWTLERVTIHIPNAKSGKKSIRIDGTNHSISDTIVVGGQIFIDGVTNSGNCQFDTTSDSIGTTAASHPFPNASDDLFVLDDYTTSHADCAGAGSTLTSVSQLLNMTDPRFETLPPPPPASIHVGDLDGSRIVRGGWRATVVITVHDDNDALISGVVVAGDWDVGGTASCTTDSGGQCSLQSALLSPAIPDVTFTVSDLALAGYTYTAGSNHDPDGDSTGTAITIQK